MTDHISLDAGQGAPVLINIYDLLFKQVSINNNLFVCSTFASALFTLFHRCFKKGLYHTGVQILNKGKVSPYILHVFL